ncbi:MAG: N-acetylmuramoyl-L-alanine amidase [Eggerthellaceae bacterium]|nr:N-acetylmuramoyl-L-alanine amidase [Eggerthellaceae bacterium]
MKSRSIAFLAGALLAFALVGCASAPASSSSSSQSFEVSDHSSVSPVDEARAKLQLSEDYRDSFVHGDKPAEFQKYIVLHDTEGDDNATGVIDYWDGNGNGVASHFVINTDGTIVQCVPLDKIAHHAGFGNTGHNEQFGIEEDGRDDMVGTTPIGDWASDYGMNAWSIGIEMVHVGGGEDYTQEQLKALDSLIAYIDAYYGFESQIVDHKEWREGNSDTSPEFAEYLANYKDHRTHESA